VTYAEGLKFRTAKQLVLDKVFPVSEDKLKTLARRHAIGKVMGRTRVFSEEGVNRLYEVLPCQYGSLGVQSHPTGSCAAPSGASALKKARALLANQRPKKSGHGGKPKS
jgi:hypothetical protein